MGIVDDFVDKHIKIHSEPFFMIHFVFAEFI